VKGNPTHDVEGQSAPPFSNFMFGHAVFSTMNVENGWTRPPDSAQQSYRLHPATFAK
jgi:hypothetical protein